MRDPNLTTVGIAGQVLYSLVEKEDNTSTYEAIILWQSGPKIKNSRWDFWKDRLRWIAE